MKSNIILHVTTSCNYDCSYCDVIKDNKNMSSKNLEAILTFIKNNKNYINRFKFFGWEPLLRFKDIKHIIKNTNNYINNNYEIVTNTTLLNDEVWEYFEKYFSIIFFSIDTENNFDYERIEKFIKKFNLQNKVYFNVIINPNEEEKSLEQFEKLYNMWFKWFNILPVYFTKPWSILNFKELSKIMKVILNMSIKDRHIKLYWFEENDWEKTSLANNTIFIDVDWKIYYSDIVSTFYWNSIKNELLLWDINSYNLEKLEKYNFEKEKKVISKLEENIYNKVIGQRQLHKLMDYFSVYLNKLNGK